MTLLYKLTDQDHKTRAGYDNETQWGEGIEHSAKGDASEDLCSDGWLHAYTDFLLAVLLNPVHANIRKPVLWEAEGYVGKSDGCKVGCRKLKTVRIIPLPKVTIEQRVRFAILCVKQIYADAQWNAWADTWLIGKDRSHLAAAKASAAAAAAKSAMAVRAERAALAARAAASAASAAWAADSAAWAAWAADAAARAAVLAATTKNIDLAAIANEAVR